MTELEKMETLIGEINERNEKIKEHIFNIVKLYGGEVRCKRHRYKAIEYDTDSKCCIESFTVDEDKLIIETYFDGDSFNLGLDSFNALEVASILIHMLEENRRKLHYNIDKLIEEYMAENSEEPLYATCKIMHLDGLGDEVDVKIKLSAELDEDDDAIFYYCDSPNDLKHLTAQGCNEFIVTDVYELN